MPLGRARSYLAEVVLALRAVHEAAGAVYRDLKSNNLVLAVDGHLRLTDFGFAKVRTISAIQHTNKLTRPSSTHR